ncbi:uncharacterized protein J3D65DRAFT_606149 [Phyllosticta citribraziliensis]|uniref:Secreted protein n=1 Tax=Phyllosticta citribraziliensis TaxID=989973 RepID=A0ABR1LAC8_9PEZI
MYALAKQSLLLLLLLLPLLFLVNVFFSQWLSKNLPFLCYPPTCASDMVGGRVGWGNLRMAARNRPTCNSTGQQTTVGLSICLPACLPLPVHDTMRHAAVPALRYIPPYLSWFFRQRTACWGWELDQIGSAALAKEQALHYPPEREI